MSSDFVARKEHLIDKYFPVLDNGFVALKDCMGEEYDIVQAARVSYGKGTKKKSSDRGLIRYLLKHRHTTPFEMVEMKFHVGMPIFVARQWIRHRTANVNEYSGRYSVMPNLAYSPAEWNQQSSNNKQGRNDVDAGLTEEDFNRVAKLRHDAFENYENLLNKGVARELARIDLPLSVYTYWYWKMDLHNLLHFLTLRCDSHAQYEIRAYADIILGMVQYMYPMVFEAFMDFRMNARFFSAQDMFLMNLYVLYLLENQPLIYKQPATDDLFWDEFKEYSLVYIEMSDRDFNEFRQKITGPMISHDAYMLDFDKAKTPEYFEQLVTEAS